MTLDKNGDGYLDRAEYKELRRLAKKAVRPKKCARTFARTCDLNRDLKLSRQEWGACLANDFTRKFNTWCTCISHHKGKISRTFFRPLGPRLHGPTIFLPFFQLERLLKRACLSRYICYDIYFEHSIRYDIFSFFYYVSKRFSSRTVLLNPGLSIRAANTC